ncbi:hypothetical protein ES677_07815 [Bizionia gelidisalsuginis]|uniref:Calx-beta domain-containing protein n=1 Tax=Bizionia gelidisalsuginis TaxID=291188 RepID=A0ABY3MAP1_9FLAO|nr:hypothetical protein [Bizionia gelidisalsuginis]TYC12846.1 hypothetical protein ES677_07815 [Bizionia gelidisalsuginis]
MKNILKTSLKSSLLALTLVCFFSCMDDDLDGMDTQPKTSASTTVSSLTIAEGGSDVIPFTMEKAINMPSQFKIEVVSGTATQGVDFTAGDAATDSDTGIPGDGFEITVPAYATSFDIPVNTMMDIFAEDTETVVLKISAAGVRTVLADATVTVNITNIATESLAILLEWDKDVTYEWLETVTEEDGDDEDIIVSEFTENLCDVVDFDVVGLLETADCPEVDYALGVLADGTYNIEVDLWTVTPTETPIDAFAIPLTLTLGKTGTFTTTLEYNDVYTSDYPASEPGGNGTIVAATIVVSGGLYTIYDKDGNLVAAE